jgi:Aspartyl/Asparaginyl beta-hydroxylase
MMVFLQGSRTLFAIGYKRFDIAEHVIDSTSISSSSSWWRRRKTSLFVLHPISQRKTFFSRNHPLQPVSICYRPKGDNDDVTRSYYESVAQQQRFLGLMSSAVGNLSSITGNNRWQQHDTNQWCRSTRSSSSIRSSNSNNNNTKHVISRHGSGTSSIDNNDDPSSSLFVGDIIKGPSLLRTSMSRRYRPGPSLLYLPGLRSLPYWSQYNPSTTPHTKIAYQNQEIMEVVQYLESNYEIILNEYQTTQTSSKGNTTPINDYQTDQEHHTLHEGQWDWHSYMLKGQIQNEFQRYYPQTSLILNELRTKQYLFESIPFGYTFFSTLYPKSHIKPHTAPMNLRLRIHLPLIVPSSSSSSDDGNKEDDPKTIRRTESKRPLSCGIRVGATSRLWYEGKALVFDDCYEHEVWNDTNTNRVLLLIDIWHPDISQQERQDIIAMFQHAKEQGWWTSSSSS